MDKIPDAVIEAMADALTDWRIEEDGSVDPFLLRALKAAEAAGYVLVPVEPTEAMQDDGNEEAESFIYSDEAGGKAWNDDGALNFWNAMLAARPKLS